MRRRITTVVRFYWVERSIKAKVVQGDPWDTVSLIHLADRLPAKADIWRTLIWWLIDDAEDEMQALGERNRMPV